MKTPSRAAPIQPGYHTASPYLIVKNASAAIDFYIRAFAATEQRRLVAPDGKIMHAEIKMGDSIIMLSDEFPSHDAFSPETLGGSPVSIVLCVEDVDVWAERAVGAGAKTLRPVADQPFGDRTGTIADPFGHRWTLTTHIEDVSDAEISRRYAEMMKRIEE